MDDSVYMTQITENGPGQGQVEVRLRLNGKKYLFNMDGMLITTRRERKRGERGERGRSMQSTCSTRTT